MLVDKKNNKVISGNKTSAIAPKDPPKEKPTKPLQVESNGPMLEGLTKPFIVDI